MKPSILTKLAQLSDRLDEVTGLLGDPDVTRDMDAYRRLTREHAELTPVVEQYLAWRQTEADLASARDLLTMLPLTLTFEDYNSTEKIAYPPRKLTTLGAPASCDPSKGDFALYAPWGNLVIFYNDFTASPGLVPLGRVKSGLGKLAAMNGRFAATLKAVK